MDPRAVLHPVGPLPPRVYWLRRLVPLVLLLVLIVAIAVSCSGGGGRRQTVATTPTGSPTPTASPAAAPTACHAADLDVVVTTDAAKYPPGVLPHLTVRIRNTGLTSCVFSDAPSRRTWTIVSGTDQIWTTAGCTSSKTVTKHTLAAGDSLRHTTIWNRHRSGAHCAVSDTTASPGTYQVTATVDGVTSAAAVFHLTS
jgi:hypothetical protein